MFSLTLYSIVKDLLWPTAPQNTCLSKRSLTFSTLFQSAPTMLSASVSLVDINPPLLGSTVNLIGLFADTLPVELETPKYTLSISIYLNSSLGIISFIYNTQPVLDVKKLKSGLKDDVDLIFLFLASYHIALPICPFTK